MLSPAQAPINRPLNSPRVSRSAAHSIRTEPLAEILTPHPTVPCSQVGVESQIFGPACGGFQEHAAVIYAVRKLAPTWGLEDIIMLIHRNHLFISDPDKYPIDQAKWSGKSSAAVNRLLHKIRTNGDLYLRRVFPADPMVWTPADEQEIAEAQQVSV